MITLRIYNKSLAEISKNIESFISSPVRSEHLLNVKPGYSNKYFWAKISDIHIIRTESNNFSAHIRYEETSNLNSNNGN